MRAWIVNIWLCWLFFMASSASQADFASNAMLGNLTSPVDTDILLEYRFYDVIWGNEQFVAVGQGALDETEVFLSPDGVAWERVSLGKPSRPLGMSSDGAGALYGVAWNGAIFVAVGERILTSPDGKSWTVSATFSPCVFSAVAVHNDTFIAVGDDRGRGCLVSSLDGNTWTDKTTVLDSNNAVLTSVTHTDGQVLAIGNVNLGKFGLSSVIFSSSDGGQTWRHQLGPQDFLVDAAWSGASFVAVGGLARQSAIFTSLDGQAWTERATLLQRPLRAVRWNGALFVAVGMEGVIATSSDGVTWTARQSQTTQDLFGLAWSGAKFVAVGEGVLLTSQDGKEWRASSGKDPR